jgi:hypothetical protein
MIADRTALQLTIARARREVLSDVAAGTVPASVADYSGLHDYVDANYYGGAFEDPPPAPVDDLDFWNAMQGAIDDWIKTGALRGDAPNMLALALERAESAHGYAILNAAWLHLRSPRRARAHGGFGSVARYWQFTEPLRVRVIDTYPDGERL